MSKRLFAVLGVTLMVVTALYVHEIAEGSENVPPVAYAGSDAHSVLYKEEERRKK